MGNRPAQFLKELQTATAHISNIPNPAVLPCFGPKLHIGIFFDGTGNERKFDEGQSAIDHTWMKGDKERQQNQAQEHLRQFLRAEADAAAVAERAWSDVKAYQRVEKFLPTSEPKIDIAVILAVIHSEKIMHSSENFFKEFDYVRTRMLLFWLYIRRY